jgi:malate dehydrogenase (oxaloacetate-decarboxylating)(NADP+)
VSRGFIRTYINKIKAKARKQDEEVPLIVFPEGRSTKILRALNVLRKEGVCRPVLLGYEDQIRAKIIELGLDPELNEIPVYQPSQHPTFERYSQTLYDMRKRRGVMQAEAQRLMADPNYFAAMAVHLNDADGLVTGATQNYADCVRPILEIVGTGRRKTASGLNIVLFQDRMIFFADTTMNIDPTAEQIATIAIHAARIARYFNIDPKIAMLSYSNFTARNETPKKMREAARIVRERYANIVVDGEMQADTAVNPQIVERIFPFCEIKGGANVLIFPTLDAGNISYKLVQQLGGGEVLGPFLMGVKKPANVLQRTCTVDDIVNTIVLTALECQAYKEA